MTDDPRVQRLIEEMLDSGSSAEEVCRDTPELVHPVREGWRKFVAFEARLDEIFPEPESAGDVGALQAEDAPPRVPGYELIGVLGRGGVGVVYKAVHLRLNRTVALKMLLAGAFATRSERRRFAREAELVAGLRHPNVVQVYDVGDLEGRPYFTMEFIEGGSLADSIAGTPRPARQAAELVATLADAIAAAHGGGVVHRDLKPSNVLLTADGTPKVNDFGLARRLEAGAGLTQTGSPVGTPSYMAPEQARGETHAIGPAVDVYALGAILYELLTGRPPFRAETPTETVHQVIYQDPAPPSRLNARVPRDLETICLKCLHKEPQRRYATAAALADDLRRFEEGRPIQARPLSRGARLWRRVRRRPADAALVAMALALVGLTLGGWMWLERQRAEQRAEQARQEGREWQAVEAALEKAAALEQQGRWLEARAALGGAQGLLGTSAPEDLRGRLRLASVDADMVAELEEIRLRFSERETGREKPSRSPEEMYADAFRKYGIPVMTLEPAEAASRIRESLIRDTLVAFLHDWVGWVSGVDRARLRDVLDRADDDDWRHEFREALVEEDAEKLGALARAPEASAQPPVVVSALAGNMLGNMYKNEALEFMREAQQRHPEDFWINYLLGCYWWEEFPQEAVGYFRAAVAIRPTSPGPYLMLGRTLRKSGDAEGAIAAFRRSAALSPSYIVAEDLVRALAPRGGLEEARAAWEKYLERDPPDHGSWDGYAQLCLFLGNEEAYRRARKALLERFGETTNDWIVAERTSLACLLLPDSGDELRRAIRLADLAVAAGERSTEPGNPYLRFVKGLALYRQGRPQEAVPLLREAADKLPNRAGPRLALAMAQYESDSAIEARKTLAAAVRAYNWDEHQASLGDHNTAWVSHVLRREAEAMILPSPPAFLQGTYQPPDNDERLALLGICQSRGCWGAAARLFADAFAADPGLADDLTAECLRRAAHGADLPADRTEAFNAACRYRAARCAALAGCGHGNDRDKLGAAQRTRWRRQAREWLRADLAIWIKSLDGDSPFARDLARRMLTNWQADPDLAGLREPSALDELPAAEGEDCLALWHEVRVALRRTTRSRGPAAPDTKRSDYPGPSPTILMRLGRLNEARAAWRSALEAEPLEHEAWYGYAELCLFLGEEDEYRLARQALLERFGATANPFEAERTGRACLLMPATADELRQAVALAERAVVKQPSDQWAGPHFEFVRGLAEYRQGRFDRAIAAMRGDASRVLGPAPALVLAMALHQKGQAGEARKTLASAVLSRDWTANRVHDQDGCIVHALRREAEAMILPNLPAFLDGKYRPQDNDERLALLGVCQFTDRTCAAARLYSDAFATDPLLAEDLRAGHRFQAARAAALAGCGLGLDGTKLSMAERTSWRRQARDWLQADLAACAKLLESKSGASRVLIRKMLANWKGDPGLAGLREPSAMDTLSTDERNECVALWQAVDHLLTRAREEK